MTQLFHYLFWSDYFKSSIFLPNDLGLLWVILNYFGLTFGYFWVTLGYFGLTLGSLGILEKP